MASSILNDPLNVNATVDGTVIVDSVDTGSGPGRISNIEAFTIDGADSYNPSTDIFTVLNVTATNANDPLTIEDGSILGQTVSVGNPSAVPVNVVFESVSGAASPVIFPNASDSVTAVWNGVWIVTNIESV